MNQEVSMRKIGILTGGGDCPGLNAVIRGVVESAPPLILRYMGFMTAGAARLPGRAAF